MNRPEFQIKSYKDLLVEKQILKEQIRYQKDNLLTEIEGLKDTLNPVSAFTKSLNESVNNLAGQDNLMGIVNAGIGIGIDYLLRKIVLRKSNWFIKLVGPYFIKSFYRAWHRPK